MNTSTEARRLSILGLIRSFTADTKTLLRQEIDLAKAEVTEKMKTASKNVVSLAVGGFVAYAGLIVLLIGLGWLGAWLFQKAGLDSMLAAFAGLGVVGVLLMAVGGLFVMSGLKSFSKTSLAPKRTIHTLQRLKGEKEITTARPPEPEASSKPQASSAEIQTQVVDTENRMTDTLEELGYRLSPRQIKTRMTQRIKQKPLHSGLFAAAAGLVSGFALRKSRRSA